MRLIIAALVFSTFAGSACASDKDTIRDACSSLKGSAKKSQCFDALERLAPAQKVVEAPATAQKPKVLMLNMRAFECQPFEFSELDSMSKEDLEATVCSVNRGNDAYNSINRAGVDNQANPQVKIALMRQGLSHMQQCREAYTKTSDLFLRKFHGESMDCSRLPGPARPGDAPTTMDHQ